jgi:hypothetical protein
MEYRMDFKPETHGWLKEMSRSSGVPMRVIIELAVHEFAEKVESERPMTGQIRAILDAALARSMGSK